ncbi:MAG: glycosyltransferase [Chloroflexi bacterium]|nr:glycosyltransferase [Chloroflexota bacterium]
MNNKGSGWCKANASYIVDKMLGNRDLLAESIGISQSLLNSKGAEVILKSGAYALLYGAIKQDKAFTKAKEKDAAQGKQAKRKPGNSGIRETNKNRHTVPVVFRKPVRQKWAAFCTVAPRRLESWQTAVDSVIAAGWENPHLFVEPGINRPDGFAGSWTQRPDTISPQRFADLGSDGKFGALQNYVQSINDVLALEPDAEMFLYFQDDVFCSVGLRKALSEISWPDVSLLSLWCPSIATYQNGGKRGHDVTPGLCLTPNSSIMGAQAYIMPREVMELLATSKVMNEWTGRPRQGGKRPAVPGPQRRTFDYATGEALKVARRQYMYFTHSLVEHFEPGLKNSSIGNAGASVGVFRSHNFVGRDATCEDIKTHYGHRKIHVVILGYDLPHLTVSCIEAVKQSTIDSHICYIDNGSEPETRQQVLAALGGTDHEVILNETNMQYTYAAQQGIDRSDGRHVLMLNNDCRVEPDTIEKMLHTLMLPNTASVCPTSNDEGSCSRRYPMNRGTGIRERKQLPWFCCLLHRDAVGLLSQFPTDEGMKSGQGLDWWWCEKLIIKGWRHLINLDAFAEHDHHVTFHLTGGDSLEKAKNSYKKWKREQDAQRVT